MIILTTGKPRAEIEGERVIVTVPSGKDQVQIALSMHDASWLSGITRRAVMDFLSEANCRPAAEVIPFPTKKRAKAGRK